MGKNVGKKVSRTDAGKLRMVHSGPAKRSAAGAKKPAQGGRSATKPRVLGVTHDGIEILEPRFEPTHFSQEEWRAAVHEVLASKRS